MGGPASAFALLVGAVAGSACSTGGGAATPNDGGIPSYQVIGAACNPAARPPCVVLSDVCTVSECDPLMHICVRVAVDGGPTCSNGVPPPPACTTDCDASASDGGMADASDATTPIDGAIPDAAADAPALDSSVDAAAEAGDAAGD